ncbi:MAG: hypothetical protein ACREWJ_00130 [Rhodoferax sp.]
MSVLNRRISCRSLTLGALGIMLGTSALAAGNHSAAQAQYLQDRAACLSGQSNEGVKTCLKEAGAALQAARSGQLTSDSPAVYQHNALLRCNEQPPQDRADCVARMQNPAQGSVDAGGLLMEAQTPVK